jgi:hypothetical protein
MERCPIRDEACLLLHDEQARACASGGPGARLEGRTLGKRGVAPKP